MKNRIKIIFYVVILVVVFSILFGCNKANNGLNNISLQESGEIKQEIENINNTNNTDNTNNNSNNKENNIDKNASDNYLLNDIDLSLMERKIIDVANISNPKILKGNDANELYDLDAFNGAKSLIIIDEQEDNYQEIALINLASQEQEDKIIEKLIMRYEQLKSEKTGNTIINTKSNIAIKQQAGVGIFIVSKNINELQEEINNNM